VETLIQSLQKERFTGTMRLHYPSDEAVLLTFLDGIQQKLYQCQESGNEIVPRQSWSAAVDRPDASIAVLKLSEEALRFLQVICEAPIFRAEKLICSGQVLAGYVSTWSAGNSPSILRLKNEKTDTLYLIAGNSAPVIEELSRMDNGVHFSLCDVSFPVHLPMPEYQVTRYVSDGAHVIWQEYELRFAFHLWIRFLFNRFTELAGRILAERLGEQLSQYVADGRVNFRITINGVVDHHYFSSMEDEARVYLEIIRWFRNEAGTAIGIRLADGLVRDTLLKLDSHRQGLLKRHIYDQYMLDRTAGEIWR